MRIETIDLDDTLDRNSSNHWGGSRPRDYDEKTKETFAENWIGKFRDYVRVEIDPYDRSMLEKIATVYRYTEKIPEMYRDFFDDVSEKYDIYIKDKHIKDKHIKNVDYFVRCSNVSLKYGIHRNVPHRSFRTIFESTVSCPPGHTPLGEKQLIFYLTPWIELNRDLEFRVFVYGKRITAISQQFLYERNQTLTVDTCSGYIEELVNFFETKVKPKIDLESYCFDVSYTDTNDLYFIEINPFGKEYSSGSALFHWLRDEEILYGKKDPVFRFVV